MEIVPPSDMDNATIANVDVSITELIKTVRGEQELSWIGIWLNYMVLKQNN